MVAEAESGIFIVLLYLDRTARRILLLESLGSLDMLDGLSRSHCLLVFSHALNSRTTTANVRGCVAS